MKKSHKTETLIQQAVNAPTRKEHNQIFKELRREGMFKYNVKESGCRSPKFQRERCFGINDNDGVVCSKCRGMFSRKYFWQHKRACGTESVAAPVGLDIHTFGNADASLSEGFKTTILSRFLEDEVGNFIRSNETIKMIGQRLYDRAQSKQDKKSEVKKSVMMDLRRLSTLYLIFLRITSSTAGVEQTFLDMLMRKNFNDFEQAVREYTAGSGENQMKSGLKLSIYYLIKKVSKIVKASFLVKEEDTMASEIDNFIAVLSLNYHHVFGDALYYLNRKRQVKLRRPEQLPQERDVQKLREHTLQRIETLVNDSFVQWNAHEYSELRDLVASRLTLFNARRGNEPARLRVSDWKDACMGVWVDPTRLKVHDEIEQSMLRDTKLMYQTGKGNHLVPVIVLQDCIAALNILCDPNIRHDSTVHHGNDYIFPSTGLSSEHLSGWHAIQRICVAAEVPPKLITATKMRHRISTLYAGIDIPECHRATFYKHMGHSQLVNENIYQAPMGETEILRVGSILKLFDKGETMYRIPRCVL